MTGGRMSRGKRSNFLKDWPPFFRYILMGKISALAVLPRISVSQLGFEFPARVNWSVGFGEELLCAPKPIVVLNENSILWIMTPTSSHALPVQRRGERGRIAEIQRGAAV